MASTSPMKSPAAEAGKKAYGRAKTPSASPSLIRAMMHVKEFMTDSQKSLILLREGKNEVDRGELGGAIDVFNYAISINPLLASLYVLRAHCHKSLDMWMEAYFDWSYAIRLEPDSGAHYCSRALILSKLKRITLALEDADLAIELEPTPLHYFYRSILHASNGNFELSIADTSSALSFEDSITMELKIKCLNRRASSQFELRHYDEAIEDSTEVLIQDPNNIGSRALLSRSLKMMNELAAAEEQISLTILHDPNEASHFIERGDIRFRTGHKDKIIDAIYDFDHAIKLVENRDTKRTMKRRVSSVTTLRSSVGQQQQDVPGADKSPDGTGPGPGAGAGTTGVASSPTKPMMPGNSVVMSALHLELDDQMCEALYRRAQAKLLLDGFYQEYGEVRDNTTLIDGALADACKAANRFQEDDGYQLVAATCHMRRHEFAEASEYLARVLARRNMPPGATAATRGLGGFNGSGAASGYSSMPKQPKAVYERAVYLNSFCQRAVGNQKDAIAGLTKIIAQAQRAGRATSSSGGGSSSSSGGNSSRSSSNSERAPMANIPLGRLYETRGTLFHELQVAKLALADLGRAVILQPERAQNYYLRGDCHSKLGNYEQALADFNLAEEKGFGDLFSLRSARGVVYRLLRRSREAAQEFSAALQLIEPDNEGGRLRLETLRVLCLIDQRDFAAAHQSLETVMLGVKKLRRDIIATLKSQQKQHADDDRKDDDSAAVDGTSSRFSSPVRGGKFIAGVASPSSPDAGRNREVRFTDDDRFTNSPGGGLGLRGSPTNSITSTSSGDNRTRKPAKLLTLQKKSTETSLNAGTLTPSYTQQTGTGLDFDLDSPREDIRKPEPGGIVARAAGFDDDDEHTLTLIDTQRLEWLLLYHLALTSYNQQMMKKAEKMLHQLLSPVMQQYAVDAHSLEQARFFLGLSLSLQSKYAEAEEQLRLVLDSAWGADLAKRALVLFALAKACQYQAKHVPAVELFSDLIQREPSHAHAYFRRAWSHKALGDFTSAGSDFETAKRLQPDDPNFTVDYKRVGKVEFMELDSEPDLLTPFPVLLPLPGSL